MRAGELLSTVDSVRSNKIADGIKYGWINEVEGRVLCEINKKSPSQLNAVISEEDELIIPPPYSRAYTLYLVAMIAFAEGDFDGYTRAMTEFEEAFSEYARFCIRSR